MLEVPPSPHWLPRCRAAAASERLVRVPDRVARLVRLFTPGRRLHIMLLCPPTQRCSFGNRGSRSRRSGWPCCVRSPRRLTSRRMTSWRSCGPTSVRSRAAPSTTPSAFLPMPASCAASNPLDRRPATRTASATTTIISSAGPATRWSTSTARSARRRASRQPMTLGTTLMRPKSSTGGTARHAGNQGHAG